MIDIEKSQPAPNCLESEKRKVSGDYKCGNVLTRVRNDFKNKCYLCETKEPKTINVEHFIPHRGVKDIMFDWNNLYWSCGHCNNTKLAKYENLLNCLDAADHVETVLRYYIKPFPKESVEINIKEDSRKSRNTRDLLLEIYNGTTELKNMESANIRSALLLEIRNFQKLLFKYFEDTNNPVEKAFFSSEIRKHLDKASNFTAFKRWIIRDNSALLREFGNFLY